MASHTPPTPAPPRRVPSLRGTFLLRTLLPLALVLAAAAAVTLFTLEREVERRMKEDVELVARGLRLPVTHALDRDREGSVAQALRSALGIRRVYGAHVYGPEGELVASFGAGLPDEPSDRLTDLLDVGDQVGEYGRTGGRRVYSFFVPLADSWGQNLGVLQLTRRRSDIDESIQRLRWQVGGLFLLGFGLVGVFVLRGHHRAVGGPLQELVASMGRVQGGERDHRAEVSGPRELQEVALTFNSMLESMHEAQLELEDRRRAQARLRSELAVAEKLAAVGELAGGVAHELGSPLSVIDGTAQKLLREHPERPTRGTDRPAPDRHEAAARRIRTEVRRMESIIRQLLEFGRRESGRMISVAIDAVVRGAVSATRDEAERAGAEVELQGPSPGPRLLADPRRLEGALVHVLRNACQAAGKVAEPRVRVRWRTEGSMAVVEVDDSGPGIEDEVISRVFEPFFTTKATGEGTGLGLAVVHGVVESLDGAIEVSRSDLGGARLQLRLPLAEAPHE